MPTTFIGGESVNRDLNRKHQNFNDRQRASTNNLLFPERNTATGFTMSGMFILLGLIGIVALIKYLIFK